MPNTPRLAFLLLALPLAIAAPACGGGGECEQLYDSMKKCDKRAEKLPSKSEFVSLCEKLKNDPKMKDEVQADLTCAKEGDCAKVEACKAAQRGKQRAKEIAESAAAGKWKDAFDDCTLIEEYFADETYKAECNKVFANVDKITGGELDSVMYRCKSGDKIKAVAPDFEKACKTLAGKQLAAAQKVATEARDAGKDDYKACMQLKDAAEIAGGDAVAAANNLCEEMKVGDDALKAIAGARENVSAKKTSIPYQCGSAAEQLEKLGTEWAKKTLDDVLKACYVELGAVIVEERGKDAKYVCPYEIKQLSDAIEKRKLTEKFPELTELLKKRPAKCLK